MYGGGNAGLMGVVADATAAAGGRVVGVIPQSLVERELARTACDELHVVPTMHERKRLMAERADAFLALPGGIGTLEELFEVWTWHQLGYHHKPIGILNSAGYYSPLLGFLQSVLASEFMGAKTHSLLQVSEQVPELLTRLTAVPSPRQHSDLRQI